jgi:hypothetical protein
MAYLDQLIWVDNLGHSSGNIWHSWVSFARLAESVQFDAAIFSLCENDAQIFESNAVHYDKTAPWMQDGSLTPVLRRTFEEIGQVASRIGTHLLIDFYTMWENDAPLVEAVGRECARLGLSFVDLLHFLKEESGLSIAEFSASPFDGHPSDSGHRTSARRIVEELRQHWTPAPAAGGMLSDRLVAACDQAVRDGWSPDDITQWALLVLEGKEIVARRRRSGPEAAFLGDLARARAMIEQRYRTWYHRRMRSAQARSLYEDREKLEAILEGGYTAVRNLGEIAFVLESFKEGDVTAQLWSLIRGAGYYTEQGRLQDLPINLKAQLLTMCESASASDDTVSPLLSKFAQLRHDYAYALRRLAGLLPDKLRPKKLGPNLGQLWKVAHNLVKVARYYLTQFEGIASGRREALGQAAYFTTVDVRVERDRHRPKRGGVFSLTLEIDYIEPTRARRRDKLWAGADEDVYLYRFEMPLLLFGDVGVGVPEWDDLHRRFLEGELRLADISISNHVDGRTSVSQWRPAPSASATHWVKLDRLLVAN